MIAVNPEKFLVVETRNDRDGVFYAVGCDLCMWWDDENDTFDAAIEVGTRHVEDKHPEALRV